MIQKFKKLPQWFRWGIVSFLSLLVWFFLIWVVDMLLQSPVGDQGYSFRGFALPGIILIAITHSLTKLIGLEKIFFPIFDWFPVPSVSGIVLTIIVGLVLCFLFTFSISLVVWSIRWLFR